MLLLFRLVFRVLLAGKHRFELGVRLAFNPAPVAHRFFAVVGGTAPQGFQLLLLVFENHFHLGLLLGCEVEVLKQLFPVLTTGARSGWALLRRRTRQLGRGGNFALSGKRPGRSRSTGQPQQA